MRPLSNENTSDLDISQFGMDFLPVSPGTLRMALSMIVPIVPEVEVRPDRTQIDVLELEQEPVDSHACDTLEITEEPIRNLVRPAAAKYRLVFGSPRTRPGQNFGMAMSQAG